MDALSMCAGRKWQGALVPLGHVEIYNFKAKCEYLANKQPLFVLLILLQ